MSEAVRVRADKNNNSPKDFLGFRGFYQVSHCSSRIIGFFQPPVADRQSGQ